MQKSASYFEGKLLLLHKLNGLESLYDRYKENKGYKDRVKRPPMYYTFSKRCTVLEWFSDGKPLSCFCLNNNYHEIHVSVGMSDCLDMKKEGDDFAYLTFRYNVIDSFICESGVQFCKFKKDEGVTTAKKELLNFTDYAVMLPFNEKNRKFSQQYTLIYSDWEVLICDEDYVKGKTALSHDLYDPILSGRVY